MAADKEHIMRNPWTATGAGDWLPGVTLGSTGVRRYRLYRPPGVNRGARPLPAALSRARQLANAHGCWNVMHSGIPPGTAHSTLSALGAMHGSRATKPLMPPPLSTAGSWPPLMVGRGPDASRMVWAFAARQFRACA
jgi:hypothetical protein